MAKFLSFLLSVTVINSYYLLAEAYPCSYWPALPGFTGFRMATVQQQLTREKTERVFFYFIFFAFFASFFLVCPQQLEHFRTTRAVRGAQPIDHGEVSIVEQVRHPLGHPV